ncbi:MAG: capsular polysaccharide biosynthesis protein [Rhizobiaceae bacterium]|nr:capsular polysaccharide biosynthesis protein [Rhizobiaceae bacterium]
MSTRLTPLPVVAFHIHQWKRRLLEAYFPEWRFHYIPFHLGDDEFRTVWAPRIAALGNTAFVVWGPNLPEAARTHAAAHGIPVHFVEDGFLRSLQSSAGQSAPFSLTVDGKRPYFDARGPSDLEGLLKTYDFEADPALLARASAGIAALLESRVSKYNAPEAARTTPAKSDGRRSVLVVGQVEDDASIRFGCDRLFRNNDLVRLAAQENPGARIVYKPHPDVLKGVRKAQSDPQEVAHLCEILVDPVPLPDVLEAADHVYTITSLAGFEALLRRKPVTVIGSPFYAGWGLTDDRQANPRRGRKLSLEALFAGVYLLYPRYFDPLTGAVSSFEACLSQMVAWRDEGVPAESRRLVGTRRRTAPWRPYGPYGLLGWRHLLPPLVAPLVARLGSAEDAESYRRDPIGFFRELSDPGFRRLGRLLYPFDDDRFAAGFDRAPAEN